MKEQQIQQSRHGTTMYGSVKVNVLILYCLLSKGSGFDLGHTQSFKISQCCS